MSLGEINCSTEISLEKEASTTGSHNSKKLLRREGGIFFVSTRLLDS